jgi:hypothetical protein
MIDPYKVISLDEHDSDAILFDKTGEGYVRVSLRDHAPCGVGATEEGALRNFCANLETLLKRVRKEIP